MNKKTKNIAIILAGFLLVGYIFTLIVITNYEQSQLEDSINRENKANIKNKANTLDYFFRVSKDEIKHICENDSIKNFFSNKALGMSMEYGLKSNLTKIEQDLKQTIAFHNINNINIFQNISLVDLDGIILASTNKNIQNEIKDLIFEDNEKKEIYSKRINNKLKTFIIKNIYYNDKLIGRIITTINLQKIFNHLITSKESDNYIIYISKDFTTLDSKKLDSDILKRSDTIYMNVKDSPFAILSSTKQNYSKYFFFKNWFIVAISLFAIPLLISIYFLVWFNNKNIRLNEKINNSIKQKENLNKHNEKLQSEIKKRKDSESKLFLQANYDSLTNLPNRLLFLDRLNQIIKNSIRHKKKIAVLFIDLDNFKKINDSLGHAIGDRILKKVAFRLRDCVREIDTVSRLGGDEFTIILDELHDENIVRDIASKINKKMQNPFIVQHQNLYVTTSIGISIYPNDGDNSNILLRNADSAMYKAKDSGKNTYQFYTQDMTNEAFEHVFMESNLRYAIEHKHFVVHYQAQFDSKDNNLIGIEALVRWNHKELGLIPPNKFIPLAEETGLIVELGEQVFDIVTKQLSIWHETYKLNNIRIAINLSVKQLERSDLKNRLLNILKRNNCKPNWIEIEVTESYVMHSPEQAIDTLQSLRDIGINISVDDFGTGYSSLVYLKRLPLNKLKIDQSFTRDVVNDEDDKAIIESIISLASTMNLEVIAEGVETKEQIEFLQSKSCFWVQGYLYGYPVTTEKMSDILSKIKP